MTLAIMNFSIVTFGITKFSIKVLSVTLSIKGTHHKRHSASPRSVSSPIMPNVVMLNVVYDKCHGAIKNVPSWVLDNQIQDFSCLSQSPREPLQEQVKPLQDWTCLGQISQQQNSAYQTPMQESNSLKLPQMSY